MRQILITSTSITIDDKVFNVKDLKKEDYDEIINYLMKHYQEDDIFEKIEEMIEDKLRMEDLKKMTIKNIDEYETMITTIEKLFPDDFDIKNHILYLKGYINPVDINVIKRLYESIKGENNFTPTSLINFYRLLLQNPDTHVRKDIFDWFMSNNFVITENGHIIGYRDVVKKYTNNMTKFISKKFLKYLKKGKRIDNKYVCKDEYDQLYIVKEKDLKKEEEEKDIKVLGKLTDLQQMIVEGRTRDLFTDQYSRTFDIRLMQEVSMNREQCDNDPSRSCSSGLHIKSYNYGLGYGDETLVCLIAPYDIVAIPHNEKKKFRCCAYTPIAYAEKNEKGSIIPFDEGSYDLRIFEGHLLRKQTDHLLKHSEELSELNIPELYEIVKNKIVSVKQSDE